MANERNYELVLKESEVRELQLALMYHIDTVMIPYLEKVSRQQDYIPTQEVKKRIQRLQGILEELNQKAGIYRDK